LVTERIIEEARKHFNCSKLEGAELENQVFFFLIISTNSAIFYPKSEFFPQGFSVKFLIE